MKFTVPTDEEFNDLIEAVDHEEYLKALIELLDDSDIVAPILLFPVDDDLVVISPQWYSDREVVGILTEAIQLDVAMRYGMLPEEE